MYYIGLVDYNHIMNVFSIRYKMFIIFYEYEHLLLIAEQLPLAYIMLELDFMNRIS